MAHLTKVGTLAASILRQLPGVGAWQRAFFLEVFTLWLSIRGRYNFTHLARYGEATEATYRHNFARPLDFLAFNARLVADNLSPDRILAFDPCFLPKAGRHTPGVGRHYSGCAGRAEWGLEFSGIAAVDLTDQTALHVMAVQTVLDDPAETRLEYYASIFEINAAALRAVGTCVVCDAYFSREPFVSALAAAGFTLVTRLRRDARLRYRYMGPRRVGPGRPRRYDGVVDVRNLREDVFVACAEPGDGAWRAYEAVVNVRAWGRAARVVVVHDYDRGGRIVGHRVYASTDVDLDGGEVLHRYSARFQQEFLFRDAKQELGLGHCQARSWEKIDTHLNVAMTVGSLAKVAHHLTSGEQRARPFSIADVKTLYVNRYQACRIISLCGFERHSARIRALWPTITRLGVRRA